MAPEREEPASMEENPGPSPWTLRSDLAFARLLLWIASARRREELRPDVHLFLYDRYWRMARYHQAGGRRRRAARCRRKAERHWKLCGFDGPPFAAAMALPVPRPGLRLRVIGSAGIDGRAA